MTAPAPLLTAARAGALLLALGVGGVLVVRAQRDAGAGARPASAPSGAAGEVTPPVVGGGLGEVAAPAEEPIFLYSSKSAAIEALEGDGGPAPPARPTSEPDPRFLPTSKSLSPDALQALEPRHGQPPAPVAPPDPRYLPSSKSLPPGLLEGGSDPTPGDAGGKP